MTNKHKAKITSSRVREGVVIDPATGEVIWHNVKMLIWSPEGPKENEEFWKVFNGFPRVLMEKGLTKTESQVLGWLWENKTSWNPSEPFIIDYDKIAEQTGLKRSTIQKAVYRLTKKGIIKNARKNMPIYKWNPAYIWKGKADLRQKVMQQEKKEEAHHEKAAHR